MVSRSSAPRAPASSSQRGKERGALRGHNTRRLRHELGGGPVNLAGVRSALPVPVSPWPPRAAHRPAAARREIQGVHSGGEMGYQGANIWQIFANEVCVSKNTFLFCVSGSASLIPRELNALDFR